MEFSLISSLFCSFGLKMASRGIAETTKERSDADPQGEVKPNKSRGVAFKIIFIYEITVPD